VAPFSYAKKIETGQFFFISQRCFNLALLAVLLGCLARSSTIWLGFSRVFSMRFGWRLGRVPLFAGALSSSTLGGHGS